MAMNNADFLSDAVALDLGKSGVKVAETLEIQVGEEWWRLINAADVSTVRAYQGRRVNEGAISGGEMDLSGFVKNSLQTPGSWDTDVFPLGRPHVCVNGEVLLYYGVSYDQATRMGHFRVWTDSQELVYQAIITSADTTGPATNLKGSYFDSANNRIVGGYWDKGYYYSLSTGTATIFYSVAAKSTDLWTIETFPEATGSIYSFFLSSGGGAKVKITTPTAGQNVTTQYNAVISNSGATALTAITNFSLSHGLHPFYLRSAESVAVAWVDATSGQIGYVLESESWATPRYFPAISGMLGDSIAGMGSLYLPLDGEFLLVGRNGYSTGNVTREPGYSFPANWSLLGAYPNGEDTMRLFGIVGTTVYGYDLTLSTMSLTYLGVTTTAWAWGLYPECTKIGESGNLDLLAFADASTTSGVSVSPEGLVLYNRESNTFVWQWKDFNSTLFPNSYSGPGGGVFRFDQSLLILKCYNRGSSYGTKIDSYVVTIADVMACGSSAAVSSLLTASGRTLATIPFFGRSYEGMLPSGANGSLTAIFHDTEFFYVLMHEKDSHYLQSFTYKYRIEKGNRSNATGVYVVWSGTYYLNKRCVRISTQKMENAYYYDNVFSDSIECDNLFRSSVADTRYTWTLSFWNPQNNAPSKSIQLGSTNTNTGYATTLLNPAVGLRGEMASYTTYSTYLRLFGAAWDLNTRLGGNTIVRTAPFAPNKSFQDEANDAAVYFGAVSGGELPYIKHSAVEGLLTGIHAIKISDGTAYTVNLGHACAGGLAAFSPCGSWLVYRSGSGVFRMMPTGATLTDGMGEGGAGGGSAVGLYVYDYLDRQFLPYPFAREGIRAELSNISKTTKITLPETQDNLIRGMLAAGTDFRGSRCILRRVFPDHLDEAGSDIVLLDGYIQDWSYVPGKKGIAFSVSKTLIDVGAQFPKRLMNMGCSHVFKGSRCRYLGEEGRCLKTRAFCTSLGNLNQFGGFPWVAARQRRVMWK